MRSMLAVRVPPVRVPPARVIVPWVLAGTAVLSAGFLLYGLLSPSGDSAPVPLTPGYFTFPFDDVTRLRPGQFNGGAAHVLAGATSPAPLLVFLHGNNTEGDLHRGMGTGGFSLRAWTPSNVIVAAPSQTVNAKSGGLWNHFDLDGFVDAVEKATGATIDRSNVIVASHSGAGCNPVGGTLGSWGAIKPKLLLVIDGCMDAGYGSKLGQIAEQIPVAVYFQRGTWTRDFQGFASAFRGRGILEEVRSFPVSTGNPHEDIVPAALQRTFASMVPTV